jgi:hypothetical protein
LGGPSCWRTISRRRRVADRPGQFSRTHVGVTRYGYREVMAGLRAGRVLFNRGQLVDALDVRLDAGRIRATVSGRAVDPHGPLPHPPGQGGDNWKDIWLYTDPVFIDV